MLPRLYPKGGKDPAAGMQAEAAAKIDAGLQEADP